MTTPNIPTAKELPHGGTVRDLKLQIARAARDAEALINVGGLSRAVRAAYLDAHQEAE